MSRIALDLHPNYPKRRDGWIRAIDGSRLALPDGQANDLEFGIFREGNFIDSPAATNVIVEFKNLVDGLPPDYSNTSLANAKASIAASTRSAWDAGTGQHATVTVTALNMAVLTSSPVWMIVQVTTSTISTPVLVGRVSIID